MTPIASGTGRTRLPSQPRPSPSRTATRPRTSRSPIPPAFRLENCVAHNGSLIPVPGRDIMIQGWYQGGISLVDWTDPKNPVEIAYHDRGPFNAERMESAGSWISWSARTG